MRNLRRVIIGGNEYQICEENEIPRFYRSEDEVVDFIDRMNDRIDKNDKIYDSDIERCRKMIAKYPADFQLRKFLAINFIILKKYDEAEKMLKDIIRENPSFLDAKNILMKMYVEQKRFEDYKSILPEGNDMKLLCHERFSFIDMEILYFHQSLIEYFIEVGRLKEARSVLDDLKLIDEIDAEEMQRLEAKLMLANYREIMARDKEEKAKARKVIERDYDKSVQTSEPPKLNYPGFKLLYSDRILSQEELKQLLEGKSEKLVADDLQAIVLDSLYRYEYFQDNLPPESFYFPLYPLLLLSEIDGDKAIQTALTLLRQGEIFLDFWLDDIWIESFWFVFFKHGLNHLDELKAFMFEVNINGYAKDTVMDGVSKIAVEYPSKADIVSFFFRDVMNYFNEHLDNNDLIDTSVVTGFADQLKDFKASEECVRLLENFYSIEGLVDKSYCGGFEDWKNLYNEEEKNHFPKTIYELFDKLENLFSSYNEIDEDDEYLPDEFDSELEVDTFAKIGRNDPCPCGSGKKYKKCCLK